MKTTTILFSLILSLLRYAKVLGDDLHQGAVFGFGGSDPHVLSWGGDRFEFQHQGEVLLVRNPEYSNGLGLDVLLRTTLNDWWSYTEAAVLRVGDETIEVRGGAEHSRYWINGEEGYSALKDREEMTVWLKHGQEVTIRQVNSKQFQLRVDLGNDEGVVMETFQEFVRVDVQANEKGGNFANSLGLLGSFPEGNKVGRDGTTVIKNANKFAKEWSVPKASAEAKLFRS